jgi:hypothetical protein
MSARLSSLPRALGAPLVVQVLALALLAPLHLLTVRAAHAAEPASVATRSIVVGSGSLAVTPAQPTQSQAATQGLTPQDALQAQLWGLSADEMQRALVLAKGPRAAFSVSNLSPIEVLGIHARTPAERRKYAEAFARAHHQDVERVLAWNQAFTQALQQLYPNEPVIAYAGTDRPLVDPAVAAAAGVPLSAIEAAPAPRVAPRPVPPARPVGPGVNTRKEIR